MATTTGKEEPMSENEERLRAFSNSFKEKAQRTVADEEDRLRSEGATDEEVAARLAELQSELIEEHRTEMGKLFYELIEPLFQPTKKQ